MFSLEGYYLFPAWEKNRNFVLLSLFPFALRRMELQSRTSFGYAVLITCWFQISIELIKKVPTIFLFFLAHCACCSSGKKGRSAKLPFEKVIVRQGLKISIQVTQLIAFMTGKCFFVPDFITRFYIIRCSWSSNFSNLHGNSDDRYRDCCYNQIVFSQQRRYRTCRRSNTDL